MGRLEKVQVTVRKRGVLDRHLLTVFSQKPLANGVANFFEHIDKNSIVFAKNR
jgi:hypothetical protein